MLSLQRKQRPKLCAAMPCRVLDSGIEVLADETDFMQHLTCIGLMTKFVTRGFDDCRVILRKADVRRNCTRLAQVGWQPDAFLTANTIWPVKEVDSSTCTEHVPKEHTLLDVIKKGFLQTFKAKQHTASESMSSGENSDSDHSLVDIDRIVTKGKKVLCKSWVPKVSPRR